jgi:hypothetical protein
MSGASYRGRVVPAGARHLAAELDLLFEQDSRLVDRLNEMSRRLTTGNRSLWSGLHPDALALLYENTDRRSIARGASLIAGVTIDAIRAGGDEFDVETAMLVLLQQAHWTIHRAFVQYRALFEERRQLAVKVGELGQQLADVLTGAGWSPEAARGVNVHELAAGGA